MHVGRSERAYCRDPRHSHTHDHDRIGSGASRRTAVPARRGFGPTRRRRTAGDRDRPALQPDLEAEHDAPCVVRADNMVTPGRRLGGDRGVEIARGQSLAVLEAHPAQAAAVMRVTSTDVDAGHCESDGADADVLRTSHRPGRST